MKRQCEVSNSLFAVQTSNNSEEHANVVLVRERGAMYSLLRNKCLSSDRPHTNIVQSYGTSTPMFKELKLLPWTLLGSNNGPLLRLAIDWLSV
jgi:hypothetical protein